MSISIESARAPQWANAAHTLVMLFVKFSHLGMEVPFTAAQDDTEAHGCELFTRASAGEFGPIAAFVDNTDYYALWKAEREAKVAAITVEVDGMVFDGDETSQNRMGRAVAAADALEDAVYWTLADNTVTLVTAAQLKRALWLAGMEQTRIWSEGRPDQ